MISSSKPRKQRYYRFNAPLNARQKFLHVHISKELKQSLGIKVRALQIRKGDTVKVMSGKFKGKTGKVNSVSLSTNRVRIEGVTRKNSKGKETMIPIYSSNLYITDLDLTDKTRKEKVDKLKAKV